MVLVLARPQDGTGLGRDQFQTLRTRRERGEKFNWRKIQMSEFSFEIKTSFVAEGLAFIHLSFMNIMTVYITNLIQPDYSV